ncbi:baseplate J/gp47 family protein [Bacillus wiedmannii]|uniref:Baseplate J/gp47 family protein n=1 Tax=Bacillus wiedmannii TaxID=1890302 RepID=A0AA95LYT5_9BACI|nr:baseplate J/gp47 family protein [Bacillus wiedmannii]WHY31657.1 baseplate J/gp47 family protein [Bacillus wiedmannii]
MLTAEGFKRKRYADFIKEMEEQARKLFGNDVNLSERGPLGMFIQTIAFSRAEENELAESIYYSAFYFSAEGVSLDQVVKNRGAERRRAKAAIGTGVTFKVDPGVTVKVGTIIATKDGVEFVTTETGYDDNSDGLVTVDVVASEAGTKGNVKANTITEIITPSVGVNSVSNPKPTEYGREEETDIELRRRYASTFATESSTAEGTRARLLNDVPGIRTVVVFNNTDDIPDKEGRPPHSFETVVYGGEDEAIAKSIMESKPVGIRAYGKTQVKVFDEGGNEHIIGFSKATEQSISARVTIYRDGEFPALSIGRKLIMSEVIKYIGGLDEDGINYTGLGMGDTIVTGKIIANIFGSVQGIKDCILEISKDNGVTWTTSNVSIGSLHIPSANFNKVVVNIV